MSSSTLTLLPSTSSISSISIPSSTPAVAPGEPLELPDPIEKIIGSSGFTISLVGVPFIVVIFVIGLPWYHYSRKNRREARENAQERANGGEGGLAKTSTRGSGSGSGAGNVDEEANIGVLSYGKAELDARSKEERERVRDGVYELEQPGLPEVDGTQVLEMFDGFGLAKEIDGQAWCELEGSGVLQLMSMEVGVMDRGDEEKKVEREAEREEGETK